MTISFPRNEIRQGFDAIVTFLNLASYKGSKRKSGSGVPGSILSCPGSSIEGIKIHSEYSSNDVRDYETQM